MQAKLVERTPRGVSLTPVGTALLAQVRRLRLTLGDIKREAEELSRGRAGHLRIGVGATTVEQLPEAWIDLLEAAPRLTGKIVVGDNDVLVPMLSGGELDLIFNVVPEAPYEGCVQEHLFDDDFVVCASANHRLAGRGGVTMADLAQEEWALSAPGVLNVQHVHRVYRASGLPAPRIAIEARPVQLRLRICAFTNLLTFNTRRTLQEFAARYPLTELAVEALRWRRSFGVIYRSEAYLPPAARRLIERLRAAARRVELR